MGRITLITGGSRSGKSARALMLADADPSWKRRYFVATAEALDDEMRARIAHHRANRSASFITVEAPIDLRETIVNLHGQADLAVIDCLTLWIANLLGGERSDEAIVAEGAALATALEAAPFPTIVVSGEVGSGIVPDNPLARRFRDLLGWTNQTIAREASELILMTAGYPLRLK